MIYFTNKYKLSNHIIKFLFFNYILLILECFRALDIVEVNPSLGTKEQVHSTLEVTMLVIKAFLGYSRSGMLPLYMDDIPLPDVTT